MAHATGKRLLALGCLVVGIVLSMTILGAVIGVPLILYAVYIWWQARKQEHRVERQAELVEKLLAEE